MRKIIDGRTYNTETSRVIGTWSNNYRYGDLQHCEKTLYKNTKGAYFLYGTGGAMSEYAKQVGQSSWSSGSDILPMAKVEAEKWAEEYLDVSEYEAEFGVLEEAGPSDLTTRERVNLTLDSDMMSKLRKLSADSGVPMSQMVDKAIMAMYGDQFK